MSYGPQGRLAGVTDPHGFTESYTYEATGEVKTVRDRLARTTTLRHDGLGRVLSLVDTLGRTHTRSYAVPVGGAWSGPTLSAGSGDGSAATTGLGSALRSGDYQIGVNAHAVEGYPAQIALYRDATFALAYTSYFDEAGRVTARTDRAGQPLESASIPRPNTPGAYVQEGFGYDLRTSASVVTSATASRADGGLESSSLRRDLEYDATRSVGFAPSAAVTSDIARDVGGRVTSRTHAFEVPGLGFPWTSYDATYTYFPDGRLASVSNADGASRVHSLVTDEVVRTLGPHTFTYDARGLLATQTDFDGVYRYAYDALGRSTRLTYPDGHVRVQVFDDLGRITSRCYQYPGDVSLDRCYAASYDAVGNPVRLVDPEGSDVYVYDALDRLTKVTRSDAGGVVLGVEEYAYNALGALRVHAGAAVDHQRPRLAGGGSADAAVPATLDAQAVVLDGGGRVTSLRGAALAWSKNGQLRGASAPVPASPLTFGFDAAMRRAWTVGQADPELYHYEGPHRIAAIVPKDLPPDQLTFLFDGVDHPLRLAGTRVRDAGPPPSPPSREQGPVVVAYYELDLAGNVRRLRARDGRDLGGYRYSAFGETLEDTVQRLVIPNIYGGDNRKQPLRWKGMWRFDVGGGTELYDARARMWSPALGSFLSVDEFGFHDTTSTLWAWPNQNPVAFSDPSGRVRARVSVGLFDPGQISELYDISGQVALSASRSYDAGNYTRAAVAFNASTHLFGAAVVSDLFLRKRAPNGVDAAMMACPIEIPGIGVAASDATAGAALSAELAAQRTLAASGRIASADALGLGSSRTALFDTSTGTLHVGPAGPISHFGLAESLGLPLDGGRYVGGFLTVTSEGAVVFDATSGTFPSSAADLPANALDMVRGTGVRVR